MTKESKENDKVLGHDPFEGLDLEGLDQKEKELVIEALGHDPFESMDVEGLDQESEPSLALDQPETHEAELAFTGLGDESELAIEPPGMPTLEQAVAAEIEPLVQVQASDTPSADLVSAEEFPRPEASFHFPADFRWGVAASAHQVEGHNVNNDWWAWEQQEGRIKEGHRSGQACNWWENAEADFDRAASMGVNALRLSIEWSRIEPRQGEFDDSALERYSQILQSLRVRNIEPMVTLHHFTNPRWLADQGGWENPETVSLFARFASRVVKRLGRYCDLWCTINEPNVYGYKGYLDGGFPPGQSEFKTAMLVTRRLLVAHAAAYEAIHEAQSHARVGLAHNMRIFDPANARSLLDRRIARMMDRVYNRSILTALTSGRWMWPLGFGLTWKLRHTLDWIGLNYYTRDMVAFDHTNPQSLFGRRLHASDAELLDGGYGESYPQGIFQCIQRLARLDLPIYITENGIPDDDDDQRPRYLLSHLHQMWHAIQLCYPVMGYYHWTLVDNFEWDEGWTLPFGLIALNPETRSRTPRRSAALYAEIIQSGVIKPQTIDAYAPELRADLLPK